MALDRGLQLWRLWSEISHQFFNRCLESIVLKSLINATRLEAVEELWSLIVGYERHDQLTTLLCHILSALCHHFVIILSSLHCVIIVSYSCSALKSSPLHELSPSSKRFPLTKRYVNYSAQKCDDHGQRLEHCTQKDLKYY